MFEQIAIGKLQSEIRQEVNRKGVVVSRSNFSKLLRNPVYMGKIIVPKSEDEPMMKRCPYYVCMRMGELKQCTLSGIDVPEDETCPDDNAGCPGSECAEDSDSGGGDGGIFDSRIEVIGGQGVQRLALKGLGPRPFIGLREVCQRGGPQV